MRYPSPELAGIEGRAGVIDEPCRVEVQVELAVRGHATGRRGESRHVGEQRQPESGEQRRAVPRAAPGRRLARHGIAPKTPYSAVSATSPAPHAAIVNGHDRSSVRWRCSNHTAAPINNGKAV